ncbi:hypothetical protein [Flavobacterium ajazii]|uniref:hypothetical protein n=1 Tax=Flavobacterium ajazii TaxID=2692318 RepID=UPI0013D2F388|nr:hypothetical protein [Flavobacterium ajazii]
MLDMLFTFSKGLIKVATYAGEAYYESQDGVDSIVLSDDEKLQVMNIDNLIVCYQSSIKVDRYSAEKVHQALRNYFPNSHFVIDEVITRKNCIYIKVTHAIPFRDANKCFGTTFSVNYMDANNSISVYGYDTRNTSEKEVFKNIAQELLAIF